MTWLRPLLLAPVALLLAVAPNTETYWYTISGEDGAAIGYAYSEQVETPNGLVVTDYQELTVRKPGEPAQRVTDRILAKWGEGDRVREIFERIDAGKEWIEIRAALGVDEAIITRTSSAGQLVKRIPLPSKVRVFGYHMFGPSRCVPPTGEAEASFELVLTDMAIDRVVDDEMLPSDGPVRISPRRRFRGEQLRTTDRMGYDGDCRLVEVVKVAFGITVRIRPADRAAALKGASIGR
jgi:hypothetical protein